MKKIKVKSAFITRFGRLDADYISIALDAVRKVLLRSDPRRLSKVYLASYAPAELCEMTDPFRSLTGAIQAEFPGIRATYHGIFRTGGEALYAALEHANQDNNDSEDDVLVVGAEKMTHLNPAVAAGILSHRENPQDRAYGATLPALGALVTQAYLRNYEIPESILNHVAVKNHRHAALNPKAHFRREVTMEEVAASPLVADPLRRLHCAPTSDGAAAVLLSRREGEVSFRGWGKGTDAPRFQDRANIDRFVATARASESAFDQAGLEPRDIDVVEIHDAFASFEMINLEEMGFYPLGQSWKALERGDLNINGRFAVNASGGMKAKGHPIGATGISSMTEVHEQLTGRAGERQHEGARLGMVQSVGGISHESYTFILQRD